MSDFLMGFRYHLVKLLGKFEEGKGDRKFVSADLKNDLWIWKKVINSARIGLPLCKTFERPTLFPLTFISDAAGAALEWEGNVCKNVTVPGDRGVAAVGFDEGGVTSVGIIRWPEKLLISKKGQGGKFFGSKSGTLEMVGLIIPFITQPAALAGQHIVLSLDNTSVVYAWNKKYSRNDPETSLLIRTLHVIEAFLSCKIYVTHTRRLTTSMATLADHLSREATITPADREIISDIRVDRPWGALGRWLEDPVLNWELPNLVLGDVKTLCKM
jgi:hypothetical protein